MTISMYQASVPVFSAALGNLSHVLKKGEADAAARGIDPATLVAARLAPDMHPLSRQVQIASDTAKGAGARLAGREPPQFPDEETTFQDLQARISKTRDFLATLTAAEIDGSEERPIVLRTAQREQRFTGQTYLLGFAIPNFFFHVTTAYAILRNGGAPLGKGDFFGRS